jgi:DNA-binding CsgD family transcriptional regulator
LLAGPAEAGDYLRHDGPGAQGGGAGSLSGGAGRAGWRGRAVGWRGRARRVAGPGALAGLTAQQREIVVLASRGLTNGEIADRLFLSPRAVASHLYRSDPKLGIAGRHQLRDLVEAEC